LGLRLAAYRAGYRLAATTSRLSVNFIAVREFRNRAASLRRCGKTILPLLVAAGLLLFWATGVGAADRVPLPRPRPVEAPARAAPPADAIVSEPAEPAEPEAAETAPAPALAAPAPAAPAPSACRLALTEALAIAPSVPPIHGPGACGGEDLVRLEAVVLPDGRHVPVKPAATLRCAMAREVADWVRTDLVALAKGLGSVPAGIDNFDAYECRGRNRVVGAMLSEHGKANALDVRAVALASGKVVSLTDRTEPRAVREAVLRSVCARFATVLGPGSDWYHEDHVHFDLAERRGGMRICHWDVYDPLPAVAPLLPAARPPEAPPRIAAHGPGGAAADGEEAAEEEAGAAPQQ